MKELTVKSVLAALSRFNEELEREGFDGCQLECCDDGSCSLIINGRFGKHGGTGYNYKSLIVESFESIDDLVKFIDSTPLQRCILMSTESGDQHCWYPAGVERGVLKARSANAANQ